MLRLLTASTDAANIPTPLAVQTGTVARDAATVEVAIAAEAEVTLCTAITAKVATPTTGFNKLKANIAMGNAIINGNELLTSGTSGTLDTLKGEEISTPITVGIGAATMAVKGSSSDTNLAKGMLGSLVASRSTAEVTLFRKC